MGALEGNNPEEEARVDYRQRIYTHYASKILETSQTFDERSSRRLGRARRYYLRGWLPQDKEAQIVDLGCGAGDLLHFFKEQGFRNIQGVDISPEQVSLARQVTLEVAEGDAIAFLEARRDQFDLICGLEMIEHFHKPEVLRFLDACHAALRPGGRLILQTPNADSPWGTMHRYTDFTHEVGLNSGSLSQLMRLVGFETIEARETGPGFYSIASTVRYVAWQIIRAGLKMWNVVEMGHAGSGVFTRSFLMCGVKR